MSSTERMWLSTTIARSTVSPALWPISAFGRMPAETTTMSQSSVAPSLKRQPGDRVVAAAPRWSIFCRWMLTPIFSIVVAQDRAAGGVELRVHQVLAEMDDVHLAAMVHQAARRLQPEQAAADHRGALAALGASR